MESKCHMDENQIDENHMDESHMDENHTDENHMDGNHMEAAITWKPYHMTATVVHVKRRANSNEMYQQRIKRIHMQRSRHVTMT